MKVADFIAEFLGLREGDEQRLRRVRMEESDREMSELFASLKAELEWSGTRRIQEKPPCLNPEHNPDKRLISVPGFYKHRCPECRQEQFFLIKVPAGSG